MKTVYHILLFIFCAGLPAVALTSPADNRQIRFDFYGDTINLNLHHSIIIGYNDSLTEESIQLFYAAINAGHYQPVIDTLLSFKEKHSLNDWFYYQLIRKTAQQISPKAENYKRYTLYKWFLLVKSGYDARLATGKGRLIFYVRSDDNIYFIPYYLRDGKQYVCLNIHDYANIDLEKEKVYEVKIDVPGAEKSFSYRITQMPEFSPATYSEKEIQFTYRNKANHFKVLINPQVQNIFVNYPVTDYDSYFNIPLSRGTYSSLIPLLKKQTRKMNQKKGVDYLMRFTRYAFPYENDEKVFGKEKRLSPEQTLLFENSDCDDRAALFFYLVKEIYNLPMIALLYPSHITIAVQFNKPLRNSIIYKGKKFAVCEPTPQLKDLKIGELPDHLRKQPYQVAYEYDPAE